MTVELPEHIAGRLGSYLKVADQALTSAKTKALRPHGVTVPQYVTLMALKILPSQSAAQLARTISLSPQTMATILKNLEDKSLITRQPSPIHTRVVLIGLTEEGERRATAADAAAQRVEQVIADAFPPDEWARARDALIKVVDTLHGHQEQDDAHS